MLRLRQPLDCLWIVLAAILIAQSCVLADTPQPPADGQASTGMVTEPKTLADDVATMLAEQGLTVTDRVTAFHTLRSNQGLAFVGFVRVHAGRSYLDIFHWHKSQIATTMEALDSDADVTGLLALARGSLVKNAVVAADALMLAAMMNWDATLPTLVELSDPAVVRDAHVNPILVHTLCLLASAKQSNQVVEKLLPILRLTQIEEMREDILCAVSALDNQDAPDWVKRYVKDNVGGEFDQALQTALLILSKRTSPESYLAYMSALIETVDDQAKRDQLTQYKDDPPAYGGLKPMEGAPYTNKGWDGFHFTIRDDGVLVRFGERFEMLVDD